MSPLRTPFQAQRVLVTGANGFIGRHVLNRLSELGADVFTLTRATINSYSNLTQFQGDIRDATFVNEAVSKAAPNFIFHLCAYKSRGGDIGDFAPAIETNLIGSLNLISAARMLPALRSIVVIGTAEEYGGNPAPFIEDMRERPVSAYSFSKLCLSQLSQLLSRVHDVPLTVLRPTLAYGPGQKEDMFLPALIGKLIRGEPFDMTAGRQTRDFIFVSDVVDAMIKAAARPSAIGEIINIGSHLPITMADLALMVEKMTGKTGLVQLGALPYRKGEVMNYWVDNDKAARLLQWSPIVTLEEGLSETIAHYRDKP